MAWYGGKPLLALLEELPPAAALRDAPFRFPVQLVRRPAATAVDDPRRLYLGRIESGRVAVGDAITVMPAGTTTSIRSISTYDGPLDAAAAPQAVAIEVTDPVDISRGDLLVHPASQPRKSRHLHATVCWFGDEPLQRDGRYILKSGQRTVAARLAEITNRTNVATLAAEPRPETLHRNDIARARFELASPIAFDPYAENRATGAFILVDAQTRDTVAAGLLEAPASGD
jgi:sulfate adenylyltransferase subunit 1 (EFTu-like GTPase family)